MRLNRSFTGILHRMRKGDFVKWCDEVESKHQLSEFRVLDAGPLIREAVTPVREVDHSGLRVESVAEAIRVHGLAGSLRSLELALRTAEELQTRQQGSVHVDVRIRPLQNLNWQRA